MEPANDITFFGQTDFRQGTQKFGIKRKDRRQHMYVIGKTGVGKTALLKNMALQDIARGEGLAIIDPHGEFVEEVLDHIPIERIDDVVYFNPADLDFPISFNILEVPDTKYKHLVASGIIGVFTKIWANVWSARMEYILTNCILALLDTPGTTLLGILRILTDRDYRQTIVNNLQDPVVKAFWVNEYEEWRDQYRNEAIAPIQNEVGQFLNVSLVRNIVGQEKSSIDLAKIMDSRKILLVNVSKGRVGEDNSSLLGAMLITKIQLAAMERVRIPEEQRQDFFLYVDEFQNFATESFAAILSEARKYRLNLILAHQYIGQLVTDRITKVRDAVFGNVGTLISFRVGAEDAEFLEKEFTPEFTIQDIVNMPNYHIYLRLMIDGVTSRPFSAGTLPPLELSENIKNRQKIIQRSREQYAQPRTEVEQQIASWSGMLNVAPSGSSSIASHMTSPTASPAGLYDAKCTTCGKWTKLTFPPDGVRPVYCKSCFKKADKEKEISASANNNASRGGRNKSEQFSALEEMGIEFSPKAGPAIERKSMFQETSLRSKETPPAISLEEAMKREPQLVRKNQKKKVDLEELRHLLGDSIIKPKDDDEDWVDEEKAMEKRK
ncbi:MAG: type IV secretion system DNA-binding domain-containing protein [Candidatus Gribaldobacteria bacterium]|nr:type IV secretion system DNA-binding domain-containing protein [Candidatus Gribaldobacteria bacterium]